MNEVNSWHIGVAAEALAAARFALYGYYVSVQYGANQPEYDLIVERNGQILKISVKGSKDGSRGLTQGYKKGRSYHKAIDDWLENHHAKTVFCLVQFENKADDQMPDMYLATPEQIAKVLHESRNGMGDTILYVNHKWGPRAVGYGNIEKIPEEWKFTSDRAKELFEDYGK